MSGVGVRREAAQQRTLLHEHRRPLVVGEADGGDAQLLDGEIVGGRGEIGGGAREDSDREVKALGRPVLLVARDLVRVRVTASVRVRARGRLVRVRGRGRGRGRVRGRLVRVRVRVRVRARARVRVS